MKLEDVLEADSLPEGTPHGWIQWKGTDVCIDIRCKCGADHHFDGYFLYSFKCDKCGQNWGLGQNVKLYPIDG